MTLKKMSTKTKSTINAIKTAFPAIASIQEIERCVEKNNAALAKSYPKALAGIEKEIKRAHKFMAQSKKQSKKSRKSKSARVDKGDTSSADINKTLSTLKNDKAVLIEGYKKFLALQKNTAQFEKQWAKKLKQRAKPKKKAKNGSAVKKNNVEPIPVPTYIPAYYG
jgi:hypothetical protein